MRLHSLDCVFDRRCGQIRCLTSPHTLYWPRSRAGGLVAMSGVDGTRPSGGKVKNTHIYFELINFPEALFA
jgi:hypothetical protein